jgi:hypothetical protein
MAFPAYWPSLPAVSGPRLSRASAAAGSFFGEDGDLAGIGASAALRGDGGLENEGVADF